MHRLTRNLCFALLLLCGCSTLNRSECQNADWRMIGLEDGARGREITYIGKHRKACATYSISPDLGQYQTGYDQGIRQYCTYTKGFQVGENGSRYPGVCPADLEENFHLGFQRGGEIYNLNREISRTEATIRNKLDRIADLDDAAQDKEKLVISSKTSERGRKRLLEEIRQIQAEIDYLDMEIESLEKYQSDNRSKLMLLKKRYQL